MSCLMPWLGLPESEAGSNNWVTVWFSQSMWPTFMRSTIPARITGKCNVCNSSSCGNDLSTNRTRLIACILNSASQISTWSRAQRASDVSPPSESSLNTAAIKYFHVSCGSTASYSVLAVVEICLASVWADIQDGRFAHERPHCCPLGAPLGVWQPSRRHKSTPPSEGHRFPTYPTTRWISWKAWIQHILRRVKPSQPKHTFQNISLIVKYRNPAYLQSFTQ